MTKRAGECKGEGAGPQSGLEEVFSGLWLVKKIK
jgi:hypothetical protein